MAAFGRCRSLARDSLIACRGAVARIVRNGQIPRHVHAVGIHSVIGERPADDKSKPGIEGAGRRECLRRAGLQAETPVVPSPRLIDDVRQDAGRDAPTAVGVRGMHRFDLAVQRIKFLESAAAQEIWSAPNRPKCNLWCSQSIEIKSMHTLRRRVLLGAFEMGPEKLCYLRSSEIVFADQHSRARRLV